LKIEHYLNLPYDSGEIVKDYKKILQTKVWYKAWTINDSLEIVECEGSIQNNNSWNYHVNYDNSEDELYIKVGNRMTNKWFSFDKNEIIAIQKENIDTWKKILTDELFRLNDITGT